MCIRLSNAVREIFPKNQLAKKAVFGAIADRADRETGICYPSYKDIAQRSGVHKSTAIRKVNELVAEGWITRVHHDSPEGDRASNIYQIDKEKLLAAAEEQKKLNKRSKNQSVDEWRAKKANWAKENTSVESKNDDKRVHHLTTMTPSIGMGGSELIPHKGNPSGGAIVGPLPPVVALHTISSLEQLPQVVAQCDKGGSTMVHKSSCNHQGNHQYQSSILNHYQSHQSYDDRKYTANMENDSPFGRTEGSLSEENQRNHSGKNALATRSDSHPFLIDLLDGVSETGDSEITEEVAPNEGFSDFHEQPVNQDGGPTFSRDEAYKVAVDLIHRLERETNIGVPEDGDSFVKLCVDPTIQALQKIKSEELLYEIFKGTYEKASSSPVPPQRFSSLIPLVQLHISKEFST